MISNIDPELRRLPVYLVLDRSTSMAGAPIEAVKEGVKMLVNDLSHEPWAQGMVWMSVITFSDKAEEIIPLTEITNFPEINLSAAGMTNMGQALSLLGSCISRDVRTRTLEHRGDYKPVIYLLTDGQPTDTEWEQAAIELRKKKIESFVACAAGSAADENTLKKITETVVRLQDSTPESLRQFIRWVSQSVLVKSKSAGTSQVLESPELPECAKFVDDNRSYTISTSGTTSSS